MNDCFTRKVNHFKRKTICFTRKPEISLYFNVCVKQNVLRVKPSFTRKAKSFTRNTTSFTGKTLLLSKAQFVVYSQKDYLSNVLHVKHLSLIVKQSTLRVIQLTQTSADRVIMNLLCVKPFVLRVKKKYYYILMNYFTRKVNCLTRNTQDK